MIQANGLKDGSGASRITCTTTGNNLNDTSLSASMFDEIPAACN